MGWRTRLWLRPWDVTANSAELPTRKSLQKPHPSCRTQGLETSKSLSKPMFSITLCNSKRRYYISFGIYDLFQHTHTYFLWLVVTANCSSHQNMALFPFLNKPQREYREEPHPGPGTQFFNLFTVQTEDSLWNEHWHGSHGNRRQLSRGTVGQNCPLPSNLSISI